LQAWEAYVEQTEKRIAGELDSEDGFLVQDFLPPEAAGECGRRIRSGEICVLPLETRAANGDEIKIPKGLAHHWFGSVFVPNADIGKVMGWVRNYPDYPRHFPEIEAVKVLSHTEDVYLVALRLKRKKVITVHYNTEHQIGYRSHGPERVSSRGEAVRIRELADPGTPQEREKAPGEDHGFLWRLVSYWRFAQVEGGVVVECESLSLSRGIPWGLAWLVSPFVESVPRESLEAALLPYRQVLGSTTDH
jgi:hypothetical protein